MYGISIDVGTSGMRMHAVDLASKKILSTAITVRHPVPGANVMDHLTFCIEVNQNLANKLLIDTANRLMQELGVDLNKVERVAICGNPIQLSIFQNMEIRDLAYVGENTLKAKGVELQNRDAKTIDAVNLGLNLREGVPVMVPPAIRHEIGADALAMMYKTGLLERNENVLVTDYGTNAEMALKVGDEILTGSAAAGPAIEGQHIRSGMLASPGAISDVSSEFYWKCRVLGDDMLVGEGDTIEVNTGTIIEEGPMHGQAKGITGTGVIAAIATAMETGQIVKSKITTDDGCLHLQDGVVITQNDFLEAAKTFGAMRAGHFTLLETAGIKFDELDTMYMSGASGTYVDALKAQKVGLLPPSVNTIYQFGNTSLSMATDIVKDPEMLDKLQSLANSIRANHIMFATDKIFESVFIQELAYWEEGMPMETYNMMLELSDIQPLPTTIKPAKIVKMVERDIPDLGENGLRVLREIGIGLKKSFEGCTGCGKCVGECPEGAIQVNKAADGFDIQVLSDRCNGTACLRCERACPQKCFQIKDLQKSSVNIEA